MKEISVKDRFLIFLLLFVGGVVLSGMLAVIPGLLRGMSISDMGDPALLQSNGAGFIRLQLFLSHLGMFLLPSFCYGLYVYGRRNFLKGYELDRIPRIANIILSCLFLAVCYPLVNFAFYINSLIPLSEWMITAEQDVQKMLADILSSSNPLMIIVNIALIAVMPAIGEELIFRGILQRNFRELFQNSHIAIWLAAFLFSAIHLQFEGFLARMVLGAVLGYTYYFTKNMWMPIIVHFLNNLLPVVAFMVFGNDITDTEQLVDTFNYAPLLASILGAPALIFLFIKVNNSQNGKS